MDEEIMINLNHMEMKVKEAYEKSCKGDWSALDDIEPLKLLGAFYSEFAIRESLLHNLISFGTKREMDVYEWFKKNYRKVLGNDYEIMKDKKKRDPKNIPDFILLNSDGDMIPVECKLFDFDEKALKQLHRYINAFGAYEGVAVASELKCDLPENIKFVKHGVFEGGGA